ncbi:MAG: hypothetical protein ACI945_001631, partial [Pseudohongiellaceae bacterium]
ECMSCFGDFPWLEKLPATAPLKKLKAFKVSQE